MTATRALKAVTVYAFLVLITTASVLKFNANGYTQTPIIGIADIVGIVASRTLGRSALVWGLFCCVLSFENFVLLKNYRGMPRTNSSAPSITPVERHAHP